MQMWDYNKVKQLKAFARVDGAYLGLIWIAAAAFFVMQLTNPVMGMASTLVSVLSLIFVYKRIVKFRKNICDDLIPFSKAYIYSLLMFFYGSLIFALGQYLYLKFFDNGFILSAYYDMMSTPEFRQSAQAYGMSEADMKEAAEIMSKVRPVDIVINFLSMNIFLGIMMSFPLGFMAKKKVKN